MFLLSSRDHDCRPIPRGYRRPWPHAGGCCGAAGVGARASRHWALGARAVPPPAERFLRFLIGKRIKPETVLKVLGTEETKP